jgi:hypothetical protein
MKKLIKWLQQWDVVWSAPIAFMVFIAFAYIGESIFGLGFGGYDPALYQAAIYAGGVIILFNGIIWTGMYMNWRSLYRYYLDDAITDFKQLQPWQKISLLLASYWLYFFVLLKVFLKLV